MARETTMATSFKIYASVLPTIGLPQPSRTYLHYCTREGHNTPIYLRTSGAQSSLAVALAGRAAEGAAQEKSTHRPRHARAARVARTHGTPARRAPSGAGRVRAAGALLEPSARGPAPATSPAWSCDGRRPERAAAADVLFSPAICAPKSSHRANRSSYTFVNEPSCEASTHLRHEGTKHARIA